MPMSGRPPFMTGRTCYPFAWSTLTRPGVFSLLFQVDQRVVDR